MLRSYIISLSLILTLGAGLARAQELSRGPYLQAAGPDSITVLWRTSGATTPRLVYGEAPGALTEELPDAAIRRLEVASLTDRLLARPGLWEAPEGTHQFEARITGLAPGRSYYYAIHDGERRLAGGDADHVFTTASLRSDSGRIGFLVLGDSGAGRAAEVYAAAKEFMAERRFAIDAVLHMGDFAYSFGTDAQFQKAFFDVYADMLRRKVVWPTVGNHDVYSGWWPGQGNYYDVFAPPTQGESGGLPSRTEAWYAFDLGPAHIVVLNSMEVSRTSAGDMMRWLERDLAATDAEWILAFWHHAPYSGGTRLPEKQRATREMRTNFLPVLERAGVDLVMTGHSHVYERSRLMAGGYDFPLPQDGIVLDARDGVPESDGPYRKSRARGARDGAVYVVTGHAGSVGRIRVELPYMERSLAENGAFLFEIEGARLDAWMVNLEGHVRDHFQIVKESASP